MNIKTKSYKAEDHLIQIKVKKVTEEEIWIKVTDPKGYAMTARVYPTLKLAVTQMALKEIIQKSKGYMLTVRINSPSKTLTQALENATNFTASILPENTC